MPGHSKPEMIKKVQTDSEKDWKASVGWKFQMFSLQSQNRWNLWQNVSTEDVRNAVTHITGVGVCGNGGCDSSCSPPPCHFSSTWEIHTRTQTQMTWILSDMVPWSWSMYVCVSSIGHNRTHCDQITLSQIILCGAFQRLLSYCSGFTVFPVLVHSVLCFQLFAVKVPTVRSLLSIKQLTEKVKTSYHGRAFSC